MLQFIDLTLFFFIMIFAFLIATLLVSIVIKNIINVIMYFIDFSEKVMHKKKKKLFENKVDKFYENLNISNKENSILFNTNDFDSLSRQCLLTIEEIKNDKNLDLNNTYVLKLIRFIENHYQVVMLFDTNEKNYTTKFLKEYSNWNQYIEELVSNTRLTPPDDNKILNFKDLNLFFHTTRKADIEMDINVTNNKVSFNISKDKPFIQDNWDKTINKMIETKEITDEQALAFTKLIKTIS